MSIYIDSRIGGERFHVYAFHPVNQMDRARYAPSVDKNAVVTELPCTGKYTPQAADAVNWIVGCQVKNFLVGNTVPFKVSGSELMVNIAY